jgi:hypothetical protein
VDKNDSSALLSKAFLNAGKRLSFTTPELSHIVDCDISQVNFINPESKAGIRALYFIRAYKKLYSVLGGDEEEMKLWMKGENTGTGGIPAQQVQEEDIAGLVQVMEYLEAMP